ncbi:unnamed protein product [Rotaria sordida]|uniref:SH3 domain-containing protein n=1 Tax=Rotaria sordida TaxID=392033 RepID=A0A814AUE0_9BILA|nr:unnamed protein product [Rotaria sordida]CAF0918660.1 unnamed protein product [Rotaria sordida]
MNKSDSHDSGIEYHSHSERLIKDDSVSRARRARRQSRTNSATTNANETRIEVPETHLRRPASHHRRKPSPKDSVVPPLDNSTTVTVENETKPIRKKKTFKIREGEEIEMTVKKRSNSQKKKRRAKSKESHSDAEARIDPNKDKILGIFIHRTDRLRTDLRLRHPFVRVHLIDLNTRSYVRKIDPNRSVLHYHNINDQTSDYIQPISTQPYDFIKNRSTIPSWEDMLIIDEDYSYFTTVQQHNIVVFFEILEYLSNEKYSNDRSATFPIAWAFLKIVGSRNTLNTERMVRLQLWQPLLQQYSSTATPDVVLWFNHLHREKYPSTLYVTIKPLNSRGHYHPGIRSIVDGDIKGKRERYDQLQKEIVDSNLLGASEHLADNQLTAKNNQIMGPLQRVAQLPPRWQKLPNSKCKIPTELLLSLNTSERGCSSIRFSHNGYFLACAEVNKLQQNNLISIFEIPHDQRVTVFMGHLQMIYDLDWSRTDRYLASASADSSVKIWNFEETQRKPWRTLAHPSYVYCVRFHPLSEDIIVTAGYDKIIRIWNLGRKHGTIVRTMPEHLGYISSLSFNPDGTQLASVDSIGAIKIWHGLPNETSTSRISADSWSSYLNLEFDELKNIPLNSVTYSPGDNFLLVSARDNLIVLIDIRTKTISRRYIGAFNLQDRIRSTFSTCGSLVFAGSEDGQVHCWHTYDGKLLYSYKNLNYTQPVIDIQFHPLDNLLAMCSIGTLHQVYVFQHTFVGADIEARPLSRQYTTKGGLSTTPTTSMILSDNEQKPLVTMKDRYDSSARPTTSVSDTERSILKTRVDSGEDELRPSIGSKNETRNRRLAVVKKKLDEMDDFINSKSKTNRHRDSITDYGGGHLMSRSTERDISPYQGRRNIPTSGYISDSGRPPIVSPLRNLTSPDLFVPISNRTDDDDNNTNIYRKPPISSNQIMYATTNYKGQRPEELSFSKNDKIKILNRESHLLWYAEHIPTGTRGYVSPNRVHISAKESYSHIQKSNISNADINSISDIPRLDNSSRRSQQKSVKFDSSD